MTGDGKLDRRGFMTLCASAAGCLVSQGIWARDADAAEHRYPRARLLAVQGSPLRARDLAVGQNYVFHYPFRATPCFLLKLSRASGAETLRTERGRDYRWQGGVGPDNNIVAFSAICAHKMTHPAPEVSFIGYRADRAQFRDRDDRL